METQKAQILRMLLNGPVTSLDALQEAGCFRLAARIKDLKDAGYLIKTDMITHKGKRFAQYSLKPMQQQEMTLTIKSTSPMIQNNWSRRDRTCNTTTN